MNLKESYLYQLNKQIQSKNLNWSAVLTPNDRTFYIDHQNKTTSWLPPLESQIWYKYSQPCYEPFIKTVPFGWDLALDDNNDQYYINHLNKTTTYVNPNTYLNNNNEKQNEFRYVTLYKDDKLGFGFVAGSEKPVIVKSIKAGGPAENKLFPNDEIIYVNGECVRLDAQCDVIYAIKNSGDVLHLQVAQHPINQNPRASNLTKFKKGNNLKKKKLNVRFAETNLLSNACINPNDPVNKIDENISFTVPNCIKIFFTDGQTKVLRYLPTTTVNSIIVDILDKLHIKPIFRKHFALCNEIESPMKLNKYGHLDLDDKIISIASRTDAYKLKIVFRFAFIPGDLISFINTLFVSDKKAFDYLYDQTANDLKTDGLYYSVKSEYIIRLICLHIQQLYLMSNLNNTNNTNNGTNDHSIFSFANLFSNFTRNNQASTISKFTVNDSAAATNNDKNANTVENCLPNCVTTKDLKKTVKEQLKEIDRIHGLSSIVPEILANSFRNADDLSKALEYYYESNLKDVIPLILNFNLPSTDQQIAIRINNEQNSDNSKTLFRLFDDDDKLNLNKLKNQLNKPIDHSNVFINKDIVKFCFLTLAAELRDFGNKQFKVKETSLYFKEILNGLTNSEKNNNNDNTVKKQMDKNLKTFNELHQYLNKFKSNTLQPDEIICLNPKLGICHLFKNCLQGPTKLANVDDLVSIRISSNLEYNYDYYLNVELNFKTSLCSDQPINTINLVMLERIAKEFIICLTGFYKLNINDEEFKLPIYNDTIKDWWIESSAPDYFSIHNVKQTFWNSPMDLEKLDLLPLLNKENINYEIEDNYKFTDFFIKPPAYCECVDKNGEILNDSNKLIYLSRERYDINNETNLNSQYYHTREIESSFFNDKTSLLIDALSIADSINKNEEIVEEEKIQSIYDELLNYENDLTTAESITDNTSSSFIILKEDKNNQTLDSLSDSDPISLGNADLSSDSPQPPPGELKQVDSLLLLNQIDNEDIIMNGNILNTDELNMYECESSGTNSSNETPINLQLETNQQLDNCNDMNSLMIELNENNDYLLTNKTNVSNDFNCMKDCDEMIESNANILVENYANDCSSSYKLNYWLLDQSSASFTNNGSTLDNLDKLIIPPPPKLELNNQDELLDKFKKATEDTKKICKEAENELQTVLYQQQNELLTAVNRDIHSSSSADSGYDSVLINNTTFIDDSKLMECLLFKNYYSSNSSKLNEEIPKLLRNKLIDDLFSDKIDHSEMKLDEDESFFTTRALISRLVCSLDEEYENQYRLANNLIPKDLKINKQDQYIKFKNAKNDLWYLSRCFVSKSKKMIKKSTEEPSSTSNAEIMINLKESVNSLSELIQCVQILVSNSNDMELNLILTTQTINIARTLVIIIDKVYSMKCLSEQFKKDEQELITNKKILGNNLDRSTYDKMYKLIDKYGVIGKDYIENDGIMRSYKDLTELLEFARNHADALSEFMQTATKIKDKI